MKLSEDKIDSLLKNGYVELPELKVTNSFIKNIKNHKVDKTYEENSELNKLYQQSINFEELKVQLANIALEKLQKKIDINDTYHVTRFLKSYDNKESYRGHFDSHLFTLVTPIIIPKTNSKESGQLVVFPKVRKEPKGELDNIFGKIWFKLRYDKKSGFNKLIQKSESTEFDFQNLIPILFLGRQCFHGNRGFSEAPEGIRLTILTHFFDPNKKGVGSILRTLRRR